VKVRRDSTTGAERAALDIEQNALKIAANATSYGMYVEVNVATRAKRCATTVHSSTCEPFSFATEKAEEPGPYFHPLLATLITGAARLMLAIAETLVADHRLEWAFCDTDSMAIAKPDDLPAAEFAASVSKIVDWFAALNPYAFGGSIFKIEDENASLETGGSAPLYCWAISAKRYCLFNRGTDGAPIMRKVSAHGLGQLLPPYRSDSPAINIPAHHPSVLGKGIEVWHADLWWQIVNAALTEHPDRVRLDYHPALSAPAISRYGATSPELLGWFGLYNKARLAYRDQVKPFGFLLSMSARSMIEGECIIDGQSAGRRKRPKPPRPIATFGRDFAAAVAGAFDRGTGEPVLPSLLKSYAAALAQYYIQPEAKFLNADYLDRGTTRRRHIRMTIARHIGKESNDWERQAVLGLSADSQIDYGIANAERVQFQKELAELVGRIGLVKAAKALGTTPSRLRMVVEHSDGRKAGRLVQFLAARLPAAIRLYERIGHDRRAELNRLRKSVERDGLRTTARALGIDPSNLRRRLK
jgi:DNA polymerase elongation subunit (family B)